MKTTETVDYYNNNAGNFCASTLEADVASLREVFLAELPPSAFILDFGCGSGRDTKAFLEMGYHVDAADGSAKLCSAASEYTGIPVRQMLFQELNEKSTYDGIWACASILHLPKPELKDVMVRMADALKDKGIIYASFKYGDFEGTRNGRHFTDFTEESFCRFMQNLPELSIKQTWITEDVRPGRGEEKWLNLILRKN